jgi:hypothetical protein
MSLALDLQTAQRIQGKAELAGYTEPAQLINRALDLLEAEEPWSDDDKANLDRRLSQSMAHSARGEVYTAEEAARMLDQRIADRVVKKAS